MSQEETQLFLAAKEGDIATVRELLTEGHMNVNVTDEEGRSPLYMASGKGNLDVVNRLIEAGAKVDQITKGGLSPLYEASGKGHLDVVKTLIKAGAKVDQIAKINATPLYVASQNGHHEVVQCLLAEGANVNIATSDDDWSPLYIASEKGHLDVVKTLIKAGAKVDQIAKNGSSPLHTASFEGHLDIVKTLIEEGANVNQITKNNATPLYWACQNGHHQVVLSLLAAGSDTKIAFMPQAQGPLWTASFGGHLNIVKTLLAGKANVNQGDEEGRSPLYMASKKGDLDVVKTLIDAGAKVDQITKDDWSPLHIASFQGNLDVVKTLIEAGAKVDQIAKNNATPLYWACQNDHHQVVQSLLAAGSDTKIAILPQAQGPLWTASFYGHLNIVKTLLAGKANVNQGDEEGRSPLYMASKKGHLDVVKTLIEAGAKVDQIAKDGMTALDIALEKKHDEIVQALITSQSKVQSHEQRRVVLSPPIGLKVDTVNSTSISISWQPPFDAQCIIREYQVSCTMYGGSEHLHGVQDTTSTELTSLEPHTDYIIRVRAKMEDFGDYCTPITVHTKETAVIYESDMAYDYELQEAASGSGENFPNAPIDVMVQLRNVDSICAKVTWKMPMDMENDAQSYRVFYSPKEGPEQSKEVQKCECKLDNLQPNTTYIITVESLLTSGSRSIKITTKQYFKLEHLKEGDIIDKGSYGAVYRGKLNENIDVAIKVCLLCNESELKALSMVHHENIVEFLGFIQGGMYHIACYIMELADTSLRKWIHDRNKVLNDDTITRWAMDIAKGLSYLHFEAMKPKHLVHCDMKPSNVLIFKDVCKICDFGSVKHIDATKSTEVCGTDLYCPPESFTPQYADKAYCASDIYSYGLTLWEMLKREQPQRELNNMHVIPADDKWPSPLKDLYQSCCSLERKQRPTSKEIVEILSPLVRITTTAQEAPHSTNMDTNI